MKPAARPGVGNLLRTAREARGLTLEQVSRETRIHERWLHLLDDEGFDQLPAEVFVRGFVRAYARAVGADELAAARLLAARMAERKAALTRDDDLTQTIEGVEGPVEGRRRVGVALAVIVLVIAATLAISMLFRQEVPSSGGISQAASAPARLA